MGHQPVGQWACITQNMSTPGLKSKSITPFSPSFPWQTISKSISISLDTRYDSAEQYLNYLAILITGINLVILHIAWHVQWDQSEFCHQWVYSEYATVSMTWVHCSRDIVLRLAHSMVTENWMDTRKLLLHCISSPAPGSHCGDKTVVRLSYLHNGISYTGRMSSLYIEPGPCCTVFSHQHQGLIQYKGV